MRRIAALLLVLSALSSASLHAGQDTTAVRIEEERPAVPIVGANGVPRYPDALRRAGIEGEVLVEYVIDTTGAPELKSFQLIFATVELFGTRVKEAISGLRFRPASSGSQKIRQRVQHWFVFSLEPNTGRPGRSAAPAFFDRHPEERGNPYNIFITAVQP